MAEDGGLLAFMLNLFATFDRRAGSCQFGLGLLLFGCGQVCTVSAATAAQPLPLAKVANVTKVANIANSNWCSQLIPRLPGVSKLECQQSLLGPSGAKSRRGFPILVRDIANAQNKAGLRILLLGGIHGDELTASALVFQWMQWMSRPEALNFHWKVAPLLNPDGLLASKPQRVNANGVDLNRNFPTPDWQDQAPRYWAKVTGSDPRRFPGKAPLSEPESRWVHDEIERFRPNLIISVHAPFGVLDFDGPAPMPQRFGRLMLNPVGVYPGSLGNYSGVHKNVPVITIELPNAQAMPSDAEALRIWQDMLKWIHANVKIANKPHTKTKQ